MGGGSGGEVGLEIFGMQCCLKLMLLVMTLGKLYVEVQ